MATKKYIFSKYLPLMVATIVLSSCDEPPRSSFGPGSSCRLCTLSFGIYKDKNYDKSDLSGAVLRGSDLSRSTLRHSTLNGLNAIDITAPYVIMDGSFIHDATFEFAYIPHSSFKEAKGHLTSFLNATLENANFSNCILKLPHFSHIHGAGISFQNAYLLAPLFENSNLRNSNFDHASVIRGGFQNAQISGASFKGAILIGSDFSNADLGGVDFRGADLSQCNFQGANLNGILLTDAILTEVNLCNTTSPLGHQVDYCNARLMDLENDAPHEKAPNPHA